MMVCPALCKKSKTMRAPKSDVSYVVRTDDAESEMAAAFSRYRPMEKNLRQTRQLT